MPLKAIFSIALTIVMVSGCNVLPINEEPLDITNLEEFPESTLSHEFSAVVEGNPGESGHKLLLDPQNSLTERLWLADRAEKTLDVQYFLWNSDTSGRLLMQSLLRAANRGVQVRILIDGFSIADRNDQLALINSVDNVEVRIYNPFMANSIFGRVMSFFADFDRLNRRMHNKSFIADNVLAITGGRNIGDHYFGYGDDMNFHDADILSVGPVVDEVTASFEDYWNSPWVIAVDKLKNIDQQKVKDGSIEAFLDSDFETTLKQQASFTELESQVRSKQLMDSFVWGESHFVVDTPGGYQNYKTADQPKEVAATLSKLSVESKQEVILESAYFVLDEDGLAALQQMTNAGVKVRVLTNSMASNNLVINHASYALFRSQMLDTGIDLFELRPDMAGCKDDNCDDQPSTALHAKTAIFDHETVYVGSMNFNLRSAYINTETAMLVKSKKLAFELGQSIQKRMNLQSCWQVGKIGEEIFWVSYQDGEVELTREEPQSNWLDRFEVDMLTKLPGTAYY